MLQNMRVRVSPNAPGVNKFMTIHTKTIKKTEHIVSAVTCDCCKKKYTDDMAINSKEFIEKINQMFWGMVLEKDLR